MDVLYLRAIQQPGSLKFGTGPRERHPFGAPVRVRKIRKGRQTAVGLWSCADVQAYREAALSTRRPWKRVHA